jgi:hypothetical protein
VIVEADVQLVVLQAPYQSIRLPFGDVSDAPNSRPVIVTVPDARLGMLPGVVADTTGELYVKIVVNVLS